MRTVVAYVVVVLLSSVLSTAVAAQVATSGAPARSFNGTVVDPSGAPIAGALVALRNDENVMVAKTVTGPTGSFSLTVVRGTYTVHVSAKGFDELSRRIQTDQDVATAELVLQISAVRETVSVSAEGSAAPTISSATRTPTPARDVPQSITVVSGELIADQLMTSMAEVVRYVPGIASHQGENNRDDVVIRGNRSSADFFLNGVRDDVQYFRDLYNVERVEALKGPNALVFGRGGGGGVINRVIKEPVFEPVHDFSVRAGSFGHKRIAADIGRALGSGMAARVNGMFESSGSFRDGVELERAAVNPTFTYAPASGTKLSFGYEYLRDTRVADRGIPSFMGAPADVDPATFYGDPSESDVRARVNLGSALIEHQLGAVVLRNRTMAGWYDRFYQNFVPGAVTADGTRVSLTAYNNSTDRNNLFNQTDLTFRASTGQVRHTLVTGIEFGLQNTDNFRNTGFFNDTATSVLVPLHDPGLPGTVTFRQNATDADNHVRAQVGAIFAQDQVELSKHLLLIGGLRLDRFDLEYHDHRSGDRLGRVDDLLSPRVGVVVKPAVRVSIYGSYSVSYLPSSGDQFSSLTSVTEQLKPEKFNNYETGFKWDFARGLSFTTSVYRLDRTNTRSIDPNDPTRIVQTGSQRTNGYELGVNGRLTSAWTTAGGYAWQDAFISSATAAAAAGARVAQVPRHSFSLWNNYRVHPRVAAALGVVRQSEVFAGIDNTVVLPAFTRIDAAAYVDIRQALRLQVNLENVLDRRYFVNANSNTNISPGAPRAVRVALDVRF